LQVWRLKMAPGTDPHATQGTAAKAVSIPILVGITGKRKDKLKDLGVTEAEVRTKLMRVFALLDDLTPTTEKLLLCGMADGVDEIAAKLVIEAIDLRSQDRRFRNWSVIGLLPLPEAAFIEDFADESGGHWWFDDLDEAQRRIIRLMPLQTLLKPLAPEQANSPAAPYQTNELHRTPGKSNPARTDHYEQLGLVLAERSTILIAVMPETEIPDRLGGTAQVAAHRLNGWRLDWPPDASRRIAAASNEFVVPPALATSTSGDVWLVPVGESDRGVDLRVLARRDESDALWPQPAKPQHVTTHNAPIVAKPFSQLAALCRKWQASRSAEANILIEHGQSFVHRARLHSRLIRSIEAFNCRVANVVPRKPPDWDKSIAAHPAEPDKWSPVAAAECIRGTFSDVQRTHKKNVQRTIVWLGVLAWLSIAAIELHVEMPHQPDGLWVRDLLPLVYVFLVMLAIWLLGKAGRSSWSSVTEDYRVVAEALRVQMVWWQIGLIRRCHWVDQHVLRYDTDEFQTLRQGLTTVLNAIAFRHAPLRAVNLHDGVPTEVEEWIGRENPSRTGQILYHYKTKWERTGNYESFETRAWLCFGLSLALGVWLAIHVLLASWKLNVLHHVAAALHDSRFPWLVPLVLLVAAVAIATTAVFSHFRGPAETVALHRLLASTVVGILASASFILAWEMLGMGHDLLHKLLVLGLLLFLAAAGALKYAAEKLAIEAEARGSAEAIIVFLRARRVLDQIESSLASEQVTLQEATLQREQLLRDLGRYSLVETEGWLRSHRERPLHPAIG
jgi:hypothetical protein